jgi:hypothetical protein
MMSAALRDGSRAGSRVYGALNGSRGVWQWIAAVGVVYLVMQTLFFATTVAAAAIPNAAVVQHLQAGAEQRLWGTADYALDGVGHPTSSFTFAGVTDAFTECIALTTGVPADADGQTDPMESALRGRHLGTCSLAVPAIAALSAGGEPAETFEYNRYWNGSAVLIRPLVAVGDVGMARLGVGLVFLGGLVTAVIALVRRVGGWAAAALMVPVLASTNLVTQPVNGMSHALSFGVMCFGVALAVRLGREPLPLLIVGAAVAGGVFNFIDFLLNPPLAWSLFAFAAVASRWRHRPGITVGGAWLTVGAATVGWLAGYALTWITRWLLAVIAFGDSAWNEIFGVIGNRLQGQYQDLVVPGLGQPTLRNAAFWLSTIPTARWIAVACLVVSLACIAWLVVRRRWRVLGVLVAVASPALIVVLWLELLSNHSQIHMFFVYRSIPAAVGIVTAACVVACTRMRVAAQPAVPVKGEVIA